MKLRFKLYRRSNGNYYAEDIQTGKQTSLRTRDKVEAARLLHAKNEAAYQPGLKTQMARAYLVAGDPDIGKGTWQYVMDALKQAKTTARLRTPATVTKARLTSRLSRRSAI